MNKKIFTVIISVAIVSAGFLYVAQNNNSNQKSGLTAQDSTQLTGTESSAVPVTDQQKTATQAFDKTMYSIDDPKSIWVVVNKNRPIIESYAPELAVPNVKLRLAHDAEQMQASAAIIPALEDMFSAAEKDNVTLVFGSGYRSYALQKQFYDGYVARDGQEAADTYSARPGTSEHQTGLSFDVTAADGSCHLEVCFADTVEGKWVEANAYEYGFIIRYPVGKDDITGYQYEPWHLRYVGPDLATEMHSLDVNTLEEFFEL